MLLYHGFIMGQPNTSPRDSNDPKPELELLPLSSEPLGAIASLVMEGPPSPKKVSPRPFVDLLEEEAINGKQGKEEEEEEEELDLFEPNMLSVFEKMNNG